MCVCVKFELSALYDMVVKFELLQRIKPYCWNLFDLIHMVAGCILSMCYYDYLFMENSLFDWSYPFSLPLDQRLPLHSHSPTL